MPFLSIESVSYKQHHMVIF